MTDLNSIFLIGRLTKDIEVTYTSGGMAIGKTSLAVNRSRKGQDGNYVDDSSFFDIELFGKLAENLKDYLVKGKQVGISGYLKQDRWEKDGQKFSRVKIGVEEIQLIGGNNQNGSAQNQNGYNQGNGYDAGYGYN